MPVKIVIYTSLGKNGTKKDLSLGSGWVNLFKSPGVSAFVDEAGERIAREANAGYQTEHYGYLARVGRFGHGGFVSSMDYAGAYYQQRDKALSRAVHP